MDPSPLRRRAFIGILIAGTAVSAGSSSPPTVDVWVDLSEPPPRPGSSASASQARRARMAEQQEAVAGTLRDLGAVELARVRTMRSSIAVRIDAARLDDVKAIPGVKRVRPARTLHPPKPMP